MDHFPNGAPTPSPRRIYPASAAFFELTQPSREQSDGSVASCPDLVPHLVVTPVGRSGSLTVFVLEIGPPFLER